MKAVMTERAAEMPEGDDGDGKRAYEAKQPQHTGAAQPLHRLVDEKRR